MRAGAGPADAGASVWRDPVDKRILEGVKTRTGKVINIQSDVGGWPVLPAGKAVKDTDGDGTGDNADADIDGDDAKGVWDVQVERRAETRQGYLRNTPILRTEIAEHIPDALLGDALRDELSVHLGVLDLEDVELDLLARELLEVGADALGLGATAADDDARTSGVDVDADAVTRALDLHLGDAGPLQPLREELADGDILFHIFRVLLVGVPPRTPVGGDAQTEAVWVDLLTHQPLPPFLATWGATTTVMWLVRLRIR